MNKLVGSQILLGHPNIISTDELQNSWPEGRTKALLVLSPLNSVETYRNPLRYVSLAKITWILVEGA
jgi:hypothetical protein